MIAKIAEGTKEDIDVAVKAARVAFDDGPWPRMPGFVCYLSLPLFLFHLILLNFHFSTLLLVVFLDESYFSLSKSLI